MTTSQTPGPAGSAIATQLTGSGFHSPGPPAEVNPGERATPAPAAAAPSARPSESRVGISTRPAGDSLHDPDPVPPRPRPKPGVDLPQRTRQPRYEPGCDCPMCRPRWTG